MSDSPAVVFLVAPLVILGFLGLIIGVIWGGSFCMDHDWSLTLMRASLARRRIVNERAAEYVRAGHTPPNALRLATRDMEQEAEANQRAIEQVMR